MIYQKNIAPPNPAGIPQNFLNSNTSMSYINSQPSLIGQNSFIGQPPNLILANPGPNENAILKDMKRMQLEKELEELKAKNKELENKMLRKEIKSIKEANEEQNKLNLEMQRITMLLTMMNQVTKNQPNNNNINITVGQTTEAPKIERPIVAVPKTGRLTYPDSSYCLFLCLNIFLPGVGTIVAGVQYGHTSDIGNRKDELICHGVVQLLTSILIFGWAWAIMEASKYFEKDVCGC